MGTDDEIDTSKPVDRTFGEDPKGFLRDMDDIGVGLVIEIIEDAIKSERADMDAVLIVVENARLKRRIPIAIYYEVDECCQSMFQDTLCALHKLGLEDDGWEARLVETKI